MPKQPKRKLKRTAGAWLLLLGLLVVMFSIGKSKPVAAVTTPGGPALSVTQTLTSGDMMVTVGTTVTFSIDITNTGTVDLTTVRVRDQFNDGCLFMADADPAYDAIFGTIGNGEATWNNVGPLAVGQHKLITTTFIAQIARDAQDNPLNCDGTVNQATAEALSDPNTVIAQASDSASVSILPLLISPPPTFNSAELTVTKIRSTPSGAVTPGTAVTFIIDVGNTGDVALSTVRVRDHFNDGCLILTRVDPAYDEIWGTIGNSEATWANIGPLDVGEHKFILTTFTAQIASDAQGKPLNCDNTINHADAEALSAPNVVIAQASADATISVKPSPTGPAALHVTKTRTSPNSVVPPGTAVSFLIDVANTGSTDLPVVRLRDHYNDGCMMLIGADPFYDLSWNTIGNAEANWDNIGPLAAGEHKTILTTFNTSIANDVFGKPFNCDNTSNEATAEALSGPNTVIAQAKASATVSVRLAPKGQAELSVTKTRTSPAGAVTPGTPVTFTIDIANTGGMDLPVVRVRDHFNDGCLVLGKASPTYDTIWGTLGNAEATWNNVGPLAIGEHKVITTTFNTWIATDNSFPSQPFNCTNTGNEVTTEALLGGDIVVAHASASASVSVSNGQVMTLFVAPYRDLCYGFFAPFPCIQTRTTPTGEWVGFPDRIAGFDYHLGTEYELRVLREDIPNPPADASAFRYTLIEIVHATDVTLQDSDSDGMIDGAEIGGPNNGDGNNDGTPDYRQPHVASTLDAFDRSYVTVEATGNCTTVDQLLSIPQGGSGLVDANYNLPYGSVSFELTWPHPGQSYTVSYYWYGTGDVSNLQFRKYGPTVPGNPATTAWYDYPATFSLVEIPSVGPFGEPMMRPVVKVTLTLTDGQLGDSTGLDGKIVDPGGIAIGSPDVQLLKTLNTVGVLHPSQPISFTIVITNTSSQVMTTLPLTDTYDSTYLSFDSVNGAQPATVDNADDGQLNWSNVLAGTGGLAPGAHRNIVVYFITKLETANATGCAGSTGSTCNIASLDAGISSVAVSPLDVTIVPTPGKSSVGDFVWHDWNGDGQQDVNEPGINGVRVNLYEDKNSNNQIDSGEFITSTVTANNGGTAGFYQFTTVPGNRAYLVEIDPSNFASGGPLVGFVFSNDKNTTPTNSSERQQFFLLGNPENKTDVDFGLYCKFDLALVKILATGQSNMITPGANVTFTLAVFNQGVVTATNISLVDYLPTGFTLSTSGNSGWVNNGATATLAVPGDLAPNGTYLKDIVLTAGAIPTGTYTNTAEITAATAPGNTPLPDIDSTPDNVNGNGSNGNSGESAALVDDQTSGDGKQAGQDEDDHDIATVTITPLPLTASYVIAKKLETIDPVSPNVWLTFTIDITNTGGLPITFLPLHDVYQTGYLAYLGATPAADDLINDGQIDWHDLAASFGQPLQAGQAFHLKVRFMALHDTTVLPGGATPNTVSAHNAKTNNTPVTDPPPSTATVRILAPTAVALANHSAVYASNQVLLHWQTESETQAVGYHIWRIDDANGEAVKLTEQLLVAQKAGQNAGAAYDFVDKSAQAGHSYRYVLEVVDNEGNVSYNELGQLTAGSRLFLPVLVRH